MSKGMRVTTTPLATLLVVWFGGATGLSGLTGCEAVERGQGGWSVESIQAVQTSWELTRWAASEVHRGQAARLCERFSPEMLGVASCQALERLLRQVRDCMGEAVGECRWAYSYRIASVDPFVATAVRSCPFREGALSVTVTAAVDPQHARITGPWLDAPAIRDLSLEP